MTAVGSAGKMSAPDATCRIPVRSGNAWCDVSDRDFLLLASFHMPHTNPDPASPNSPENDAPQENDALNRRGSRDLGPTASATTRDGLRRLWVWALTAGLLGGLMTWAGGEVAWRGIRSARAPKLVPYPTEEDHARVIRGIVTNTAVSFLQQGAILGAVLGLAGGLAQRSSRAALQRRIAPTSPSGQFPGRKRDQPRLQLPPRSCRG